MLQKDSLAVMTYKNRPNLKGLKPAFKHLTEITYIGRATV
jgi:hypothetical protein